MKSLVLAIGVYNALLWRQNPRRLSAEALRDASEIGRYGTLNQFNRQFSPARVQSQLIDNHLASIESYVASFFLAPVPPPTPNAPPASGS